MQPGLHPLSCSRCGAPLDPGSSVLGAVVRCGHCQQAHLWVAPDRVEAQGSPPAAARGPGGSGKLLVAAVVVVGVLAFAGLGVVLMFRGKPRPFGEDRRLPADAPLVIGDRLEMAIQSKNHFESCSFEVMGVEPDGRVLGVPCGGTTPAPVSRELLRAETYQSVDPGNVALYRAPSGWLRAEVIGPEPGEQLRLRTLGEGGAELLAPRTGVIALQRGAVGWALLAPLPSSAPLEVGDLIGRREGAVLEEGKLLSLGDVVSYDRGSAHDGRFESFKETPRTASRQVLVGHVVVAGTKLEPGDVVLAPVGGGWQRRSVVIEEPHLWLRTRAADGSEQGLVKQGCFLIRVADKTPPAPSKDAAARPSVAPLTRGFRKCFEAALAKNPKAQGRVEARLEIDATGTVTRAEMTPSGDLPASVPACMKAHALATKLSPSEGGPTKLVMPVVFTAR